MKLKLVVVSVLLSLFFSMPAFAGQREDVDLPRSGTLIFDGRIDKLPSGEFPEPIEVSFGSQLVTL